MFVRQSTEHILNTKEKNANTFLTIIKTDIHVHGIMKQFYLCVFTIEKQQKQMHLSTKKQKYIQC